MIDGKLQVTGGNANLFLMNPAGIVFGKGASLDINGAFTATTAKAIDFGNGNCDDDATFSVNGQTVSFKLK